MSKRKRNDAQSPSSRPFRVGEQIRQVLGEVLGAGRIKDPRLSDVMITVTEVRMTPDLQHAKVFVSVFGKEADEVMAGLESAKGLFRRTIGREIRLKFTPELRFLLDESIERGARMEALIKENNAPSDSSLPDDEE